MANRSKPAEWQELTQLVNGRRVVVERVSLPDNNVAIEGAWELPQLARLSMDDQVFITAFVRSHGSIKEMEQVFGVSYPTIKNRLNRIADSLEFVEIVPEITGQVREDRVTKTGPQDVLARLKRGEITAAEAVQELEALK